MRCNFQLPFLPAKRCNFRLPFTTEIAGELRASSDSEAFGHVDLLTVVTHEFGHILGLPDLEPVAQARDIMEGVLPTGIRSLPTPTTNDTREDKQATDQIVNDLATDVAAYWNTNPFHLIDERSQPYLAVQADNDRAARLRGHEWMVARHLNAPINVPQSDGKRHVILPDRVGKSLADHRLRTSSQLTTRDAVFEKINVEGEVVIELLARNR